MDAFAGEIHTYKDRPTGSQQSTQSALALAFETIAEVRSGMVRIQEGRRKWWVLAAMGGVLGLVLLDETVVGVALPTLRVDLGMSTVTSHWVVNAYLLVFAGLVAFGGKLGDVAGHKALFFVGVGVFGLASLAAGFADHSAWLITARGVQGVGAAVIFPASLAMITIVFPERQRGLALGIYGAIGGLFLVSGPLIGGFFTEVVSWRWIFWINLPLVTAIALIVVAAWQEPPRHEAPSGIDYFGLVALVLGLSTLVFAIMQGSVWGWGAAATLALLTLGMVAIVAFVIIERRVKEPLIDIDLLGNATFAGCNLVIFQGQFNRITGVIFGALYLQDVLDMNPLQAGVALLPAVVPGPFAAVLAGRLADRCSVRVLSLSALLVTAAALVWIAWAVSLRDYRLLAPALAVWVFCQPFLLAPTRRTVMGAVGAEKRGAASGIAFSAQTLGGTIGMAVGGTVLTMTGKFSMVFLTNAVLVLAVLAIGYFTIERHDRAHGPGEQRSEA